MQDTTFSLDRIIKRTQPPRRHTSVDHQMILAFILLERARAARAGDIERVEKLTRDIETANPMYFDWAYSRRDMHDALARAAA